MITTEEAVVIEAITEPAPEPKERTLECPWLFQHKVRFQPALEVW